MNQSDKVQPVFSRHFNVRNRRTPGINVNPFLKNFTLPFLINYFAEFQRCDYFKKSAGASLATSIWMDN